MITSLCVPVRVTSKWVRASALGFALAVPAGCGGDATGVTSGGTPSSAVSLAIVAPAKTILVGETILLTARAVSASGATVQTTPTWSSTNDAVAHVDATGKVYGAGTGTATIQAVVTGMTASVDLTVSASAVMLDVSASSTDVCGIASGGQLYCAGGSYSNVPSPVAPNLRFKAVKGFGARESTDTGFCAIASDDSAYCWGTNDSGQLGVGDTQSRTTPTPVAGGLHFRSISPGDYVTCGVTLDNVGYCWGAGSTGDIGDGNLSDRLVPTRVHVDAQLQTISSGNYSSGGKNGPNGYSCALSVDGRLYCWGGNTTAQLGDGNEPTSSSVPHLASTAQTFKSLNQNNTLFACALTAEGVPYCWGNGEALQASTLCPFPGGVHACVPVPTAVDTPLRFTMLTAASLGGMCGITANHEVACWGVDADQRFGLVDSQVCANGCAQPVVSLTGFQSVSSSVFTTCGIATNQRAYCWGDNSAQQIMASSSVTSTNVPALFKVPGVGGGT